MINLPAVRPTARLLALLLLLLPSTAVAQATTGSISGTITDESAAVLPGVTLLVTNVDTGVQRTQVSDENGRYRVLNLNPGTYTVTGELEGFTSVVRDSLVVAIGKDLLADIEMKIGGVTEQVTVTGETSSVSLGTTTAGGVVTTKQIAELPLNGRPVWSSAAAPRETSPEGSGARSSPSAERARRTPAT